VGSTAKQELLPRINLRQFPSSHVSFHMATYMNFVSFEALQILPTENRIFLRLRGEKKKTGIGCSFLKRIAPEDHHLSQDNKFLSSTQGFMLPLSA
jgi:hypothetical protein